MLYEKCQLVKVKKDEWNCRCPLCGDSTTKPHVRRFHINYYPTYDTFMFKCHRCGESNNIYMLYCILYDKSYKEAKKFLDDTVYNKKNIQKRIKRKTVTEDKDIKSELDLDIKKDCYTIYDMPNSLVSESLINKLKLFIKKRCIKEQLFIAHSGRYKGRVIVPIINNGILEYFQGRSLYNDVEPKYLNPIVEKEGILLHRDRFDKNKPIVVTEGIIDGMTVGNQGTCCLGSYISDDFLANLIQYTNKGIIICLDNIFIDKAAKLQLTKIIKNSKYSKILKFFIMPNEFSHIKDVNELSINHNVGDIFNFIQLHSHSDFYIKTKIKLIS